MINTVGISENWKEICSCYPVQCLQGKLNNGALTACGSACALAGLEALAFFEGFFICRAVLRFYGRQCGFVVDSAVLWLMVWFYGQQCGFTVTEMPNKLRSSQKARKS